MGKPTSKKDAHAREFPQRSFYPSSLRPLHRSVLDAVFLNELFGRRIDSVGLKSIKDQIRTGILRGDKLAKQSTMDLFDDVLFTSTQGFTGNKSDVLRISHPVFGRLYSGKGKSYGAEHWVRSFLVHGLGAERIETLRAVADCAVERPKNVLERGVEQALLELVDPQEEEIPVDSSMGKPAFPHLHEKFGDLVDRRLPGPETDLSSLDPTDAQAILFDTRKLFEVMLWLYWVHLHVNAAESVRAFRDGDNPRVELSRWYFGYETEAVSVAGRPFAPERSKLENVLYRGSLALNALVACHQALDLDDAYWFTELDELPSGDASDRLESIAEWIEAYEDLVGEVTNGLGAPRNLRDGIVRIYDAIKKHYEPGKPTQKFPYTVGYGVARNLGQGENCHLLTNLGGGRNRGLTTMFDLDFLLLMARATADGSNRVRWGVIRREIEEVGILIDDRTEERILGDLKERGLVRTLSDSGEAVYVEIQ